MPGHFVTKEQHIRETFETIDLIEKLVDLAKETFENVMKQMPAYKRSEILAKTSQLILSNIEDMAQTIALEGGKLCRRDDVVLDQ